jgi:CHAT domain-containing protein
LPPLPETADELREEARILGAPRSSVYLGRNATVPKVKSLDLTNVRVIAFATHGLVAGELPMLAEPALALTPPTVPTEDDDGLLRASEVSQLKLNADWVLLSACNTAAADGTLGAEGLSGLAKAFFYAGARSILVSHWPVESNATVQLMTDTFNALKKDPAIGRAGALRHAMLAMIDEAGKSQEGANQAHPSLWAPFVIVGDGGANR